MHPKNLIIAIVLGIAMAAGLFVATTLSKPAELQTAFVLPAPMALPEFSLLDQHSEAVGQQSFRGQWDLVFFGFTNCPDVCPTTLQILANAKRELSDAGIAESPRIVLVSVDPERDTPELLGRYVNYFGDDNLAVTGELAEIIKLTTPLGIYFEKSQTDDENYGVDHSAAVLVVNPDGEFSALFSAPHAVADYVHDLPIIVERN
jgi:protein SCO1/2